MKQSSYLGTIANVLSIGGVPQQRTSTWVDTAHVSGAFLPKPEPGFILQIHDVAVLNGAHDTQQCSDIYTGVKTISHLPSYMIPGCVEKTTLTNQRTPGDLVFKTALNVALFTR